MTRRNRRTQRGGVFILSLAILAGLVAVLAAAAASQRLANQAEVNRMEKRRARIAAEAGIQRALAVFETQPVSPTLQTDEWYTLGDNGNEKFTVGSESFRIQIIDAASRVNLNTADQTQLETLPLTGEQVDTLLDWRSADAQPRTDGAKDAYYNGLTHPYNAKLRKLDTVDETLLIKGWTAQTLYDSQETSQVTSTTVRDANGDLPVLAEMVTVDSNSQAVTQDGTARLNVAGNANAAAILRRIPGMNQATATAIAGARPTTMSQLLQSPGVSLQNARDILTNLTTTAQNEDGKINLNTATQEVLQTVPNLPPDVVNAIIARQATGFTDLGDLVDVPGMNNLGLLAQTAGYFDVNSTTFIVRVIGHAGASSVALEAIIKIADNQAKVVRIEQPPYADVLTRWGWETDTTNETVLKEAS